MSTEGFRLFDGRDPTKKAKFILSGITPGSVRALTIPNQSGVISFEGHSHTFLNLADTPDSYNLVDMGKILQVKEDLTGLEFTSSPAFTKLTLLSIAAEDTDVDKFLVASSGVIKYRTGAQLLSDINGAVSTHSHADNGSGGGGFSSRCSVYRNSSQSIPKNTLTKIEFNTKLYDSDNEFDSTIDHRFKAIVEGYYHITGQVWWESISNTVGVQCRIVKNGIEIDRVVSRFPNAFGNLSISKDVYLDGDADYIELFVYHGDVTSKNISGYAQLTYMDIHRFA